jgi:hypothetical protein
VKVTAPPIKKNGSSELSGFYPSIFGFLASYRVSGGVMIFFEKNKVLGVEPNRVLNILEGI